MSYSAEISRTNPSCFLFLIDRSGSMEDPFGAGESNRSKADGSRTWSSSAQSPKASATITMSA
jgi:hypothetical protein